MTHYKARWIKDDRRDDSWKRHTISPPHQERKHGSWIGIALILAAVGAFMAYGMVQGDRKAAEPAARVVWETGK